MFLNAILPLLEGLPVRPFVSPSAHPFVCLIVRLPDLPFVSPIVVAGNATYNSVCMSVGHTFTVQTAFTAPTQIITAPTQLTAPALLIASPAQRPVTGTAVY